MKNLFLCIPLMGMLLASSCTENTSAEGTTSTDESSTETVGSNLQDSSSYALGILITKDLGKPTFDTIYSSEFIQAMDDYFNQSSAMGMTEAGQILQNVVTNPDAIVQLDQISYAFGTYMANVAVGGQNLEDINPKQVMKALNDVLIAKNPEYTQEQAMAVFERFMAEKDAIMREQASVEGEKNQEIGEKFLAENAKKSGVITTASGLQYEVMIPAKGPKPASASTRVKVHYTGTLINGDVFDSSVERGTPAEFALNGVIKGWTEGVMLMEEGSKYKFYIPGDLAYGASPRPGGPIGPNETLIFEVELLEILD